MICVGAFGLQYLGSFLQSGELDPRNQYRAAIASEKLFGRNGLADFNGDGKVSDDEMIDAYRIMGLDYRNTNARPNLFKLERAVQYYMEK